MSDQPIPQDLTPEPPPPSDAAPVAHLDLKARLLLLVVALLLAGAAAYVMYARGAFERTQRLVLIADHAEGTAVGMDLSFAGFPIGRVSRIELGDDGKARIVVAVAQKDARWLRVSSVFTMESSLVGAPRLRAYSGILTDPPLPDGAERPVLIGDATAEIPRLVADVRSLLANLTALSADDAALAGTLRNLQATTEKLNGPGGALGAVLGEDGGRRLIATLERTNQLLARLDGLAQKADTQVFGERGLLRDTQGSVQQLNGLLGEARQSLKKVDALLVEAQAIAGNAREASTDLGQLRAEVEASLRKVEQMLTEVNRRWPFNKRETEIKLP
ncbi:mammalian cell entry protein [Roseateles sp. DAIF2]|uniref:MlaD family protein n=1 Tax=Roseateles sp. DAIF2 TaxID=2714952 RepID=UPI0018A2AEC0|nr:MlaD family protein [Roseateles sp. DAIF2]QPF76182.1 mammalian cell entry protein [Roseateles sp. DAIF2]